MRSDDGKDEKERMTQEPDSVIVLRLLGPYLWGGVPLAPQHGASPAQSGRN